MARQVFRREDFDNLAQKLGNLELEPVERELLLAVFSAAGNLVVGLPTEDPDDAEATIYELLEQIRDAFIPGGADESPIMFRIGGPIVWPPPPPPPTPPPSS
jgi:hypothetical protein